MKKTLKKLVITAGVIGAFFAIPALATVFLPFQGGTGTGLTPASGTIPIGNGAGTYTPGFLTAGGGIQITNSSGTIIVSSTISSSGGSGSATTTINGVNGPTFIFGTSTPITLTVSGTTFTLGFNTTTPLTLSGLLTLLGGLQNNGNETTTNLTVSSTLRFPLINASGTQTYSFSNDTSGFLEINATGNTPGSGATTTQPWNIVLQNCPYSTSTSNQSECDWSMSTTYPDGTRTFSDLNQQEYSGIGYTGWFETATGASSTANAFLYPFHIQMSNNGAGSTLQHHDALLITPVAPTGTWAGFTLALNGDTTVTGQFTDTATSTLGGNASVSGNLSVGTATQNGNLYISSAGTTVARINRGATNNFGLLVFSTGGTDDWNFGQTNNSTHNFIIQDAANGGSVIQAIQNGSTTIGNSGTGIGVILGSATTASTTLTVNQTSTLKGNVSTTIASAPFLGTSAAGIIQSVSTSTLKTYTDTFGYSTSTSSNIPGVVTSTGVAVSGTLLAFNNGGWQAGVVQKFVSAVVNATSSILTSTIPVIPTTFLTFAYNRPGSAGGGLKATTTISLDGGPIFSCSYTAATDNALQVQGTLWFQNSTSSDFLNITSSHGCSAIGATAPPLLSSSPLFTVSTTLNAVTPDTETLSIMSFN